MRILLAEDTPDMNRVVTAYLTHEGFEVDGVFDGGEALSRLRGCLYSAAVLDIMIPVMDGLEVLRRLREDGIHTPIMMLTAKAQKDDRIEGFDAGADDYLPKPFAPDELLSRVRALLRRTGEFKPTVLSFGDLTLDPSTGILSCGCEGVRLSGREFQLMELFLRSPKIIFSVDKIMERIWGWDSDAEINVVWVHISNLRKKLKSIGSTVSIRANRGMGYVLEAER